MTTQQAFESAMRFHQRGEFLAAEKAYRGVLALDPQHADALQLLGMVVHQLGRSDEAFQLIQRAISISPQRADFYCNLGIVFAGLGRWEEAIGNYRQALLLKPQYPEAFNNLGIALANSGKREEAVAAYREAVALRAGYFEAINNLGTVLFELGQREEAVAAYRKSISLRPDFAQAHLNLGNALREMGDAEQAVVEYRRALLIDPEFAQAHFNLANAFRAQGKLPEAIAAYRQTVAIQKDFAGGYNNLGNALRDAGQLAEATEAFRAALKLQPALSMAAFNLGIVLQALGKNEEATKVYRALVAQQPEDAEAWNNLGIVLGSSGKLDEAAKVFAEALRVRPALSDAYNNLAATFKEMGRTREAIQCFEKMLPIAPDFLVGWSNYLLVLHYSEDHDGPAILREMKKWDARFAEPLRKTIRPFGNVRQINRKLKIGYVSPDFCDHVVGRNILPLLREQDRESFEIYCYCNMPRGDAFTEQFRQLANGWREIAAMSDEQVAELIRNDGIDILVDLTGHTHRNRLLAFARKPAPVQVTFGGYPGGTGLGTMDYHLTDVFLDPPGNSVSERGITEDHYVEKLVRMPDSFWCYDPRAMGVSDGPAVNESPAVGNGYVTLGCLNNLGKISQRTLRLWAKVLAAVPGSHILLHAPEGSCRQRLIDELGVESDRVEFIYRYSRRKYLEAHYRIDLSLDSLPYGCHTTGLDCLWMSVPIVTRIGETASGRAVFSHLSNLKLTELVAETDEEFVGIATGLARDLGRLAELRGMIRMRMLGSPLTDARRFARNVENGFREMWGKWASSND